MKRFDRALLGAVSAAAIAMTASVAPAAMDAITPQEKALIGPAKAEGAVVFINPLFQVSTANAMQATFRVHFGPGDDFGFRNLRKGTGATVAQVTQEIKGGPHPNAGKLLVEFLMSKAGADDYVEGEILYSFREGYVPPESVQPCMFDLSTTKVIGMEDWLSAQREFKQVREKWQSYFQ